MKGFGQLEQNNKGFSLIELMVSVAVIAILAATAVPAIVTWIPNYRLKKATMDIHNNFQRAKLTAIKQKCLCTINFDQDVAGTLFDYIVFIDLNNNSEYDGNLFGNGIDEDNDGADDADEIETIIASVQLINYQDVSVDMGRGGYAFNDNDSVPKSPSISFRPNGIPTDNTGGAASGTVSLINTNNRTRQIQISASGSIRVTD